MPGRGVIAVGNPDTPAPPGWKWTLLTDLAELGTGHTPSRRVAEYWDGDVPWLNLRDAAVHHGGVVDDTFQHVTELGLENSAARWLPANTVCLSRTASVGNVVMMGRPMATSQDFVTWSCGDRLDPKFLLWALLAEGDDIRRFGKGTTHTTIYFPEVKAFHICLPPLAEQRRIVATLDRLSARSATARHHLARIPLLAARAKQAVLVAAFRGELTAEWRRKNPNTERACDLVARTPEPSQSRGGREATSNLIEGVAAISVNDPGTALPEGWVRARLRRIARQETGHTPSRSHPEWWGGDVPWIGIKDANAHHGQVIDNTFQTINEDGLANSSARLLPAGTVCLSRTASVGYVTMIGRPMATSQDFATWTCTDALEPMYLMYGLMSEGDDIRRFGEGSTHTTIYFPEIRAFHIKLAPLEEQREIVRRITAAFGRIDRFAAEAERASHLLDRLDEALLAKAFRGTLVPQVPADEPASALLERIRAERAAALAPKRRRRASASPA